VNFKVISAARNLHWPKCSIYRQRS